MSTGQVLMLMLLIGALAVVYLVRRSKAQSRSSTPIGAPPVDLETLQLRDWSELADEVCAQVFPEDDPSEIKKIFARYQFKFSRKHEFAHEPPREVVDDVIRSMYPSHSVADVNAVLKKYKNIGPVVSETRLHLDILKASQGRFGSLPELVKQANRDFRDIVMTAESPRYVEALFRPTSTVPEERDALTLKAVHADLREFVAWLKGIPDE